MLEDKNNVAGKSRKDEFKESLGKLLKGAKIVSVSEGLPAGSYIVTQRVEDFKPETNDLWDNEGNKSYPSEITFSKCQKQVVMSVIMKNAYEKTPPGTVEIVCNNCVFKTL